MKFFTSKETTKKILIAILLVMSFNFITPVASQAVPRGGKLFEPLFQLTCGIADLFIKGMQYIFMGDGDIMEEDPTVKGGKSFYIEYSPGVIFSNKVAALDVNFFNPGPDYQVTEEKSKTKELKRDSISKVNSFPSQAEIDAKKNALLSGYGYDATKAKEVTNYATIDGVLGAFSGMNGSRKVWSWEYNESVYYYIQDYTTATSTPNQMGMSTTTFMYTLYLLEENDSTNSTTGETIKSSASVLQKTISTWYKALRAFALVGLLSVLVYIGIRILISSTGQEKAKYKKMIIDWVAAICILFVLQYIMIFTLKITESITNVLSVQVIGENGRDNLISDLRLRIGLEDETKIDYTAFNTFIDTIMYIALVIETGIFSVHYLKRLVYMAFFTMIAPLIALTYPLDKIKDGQAQAFGMWIREYVFNALIQPVHLLLYYIFITSAIDLANENPLYAVVALGFMMPAEKFFRKMFGFEKASSVSQVGAAAGGALVMNAINKMGQKSGKQAADSSNGASSKGVTRTPSSNALSITPGTPAPGSPQPPVPGAPQPPAPGSPQPPAPGGPQNPAPGGPQNPAPGSPQNPAPGNNSTARPKIGGFKAGAAAVGRRYFNKDTAKKAGRMARKGIIGGIGAATLGTIGLAAGVATGDLGKAMQYGAAGAGAGYMGANYAGDKILAGEKNIRETFKEGYIGQDEYNNRKLDKEFYSSKEFRDMVNNNNLLPEKTGRGRTAAMKEAVQTYRDNGITDTSKITAAMQKGLSPEDGAYAIRLADMIGRSGWNNPKTREDFERRYKSNIPNDNNGRADTIWNSIEDLL